MKDGYMQSTVRIPMMQDCAAMSVIAESCNCLAWISGVCLQFC